VNRGMCFMRVFVMCGICGYVGVREATPVLREMLCVMERHRLGFESAGIATVHNGRIVSKKSCGSVCKVFPLGGDWSSSLQGNVGIGHVRYPSPIMSRLVGESRFAHPFLSCDRRIALVHNGTINDYREIWSELDSHEFSSYDRKLDTINDSEVIVHLLEEEILESRDDMTEAVRRTCERLSRNPQNQFLFAFVYVADPSRIYVVSGKEFEGKRKIVVAHKEGFGSVFASYRDSAIDGREPVRFEALKPYINLDSDKFEILDFDTAATLTKHGYSRSKLSA